MWCIIKHYIDWKVVVKMLKYYNIDTANRSELDTDEQKEIRDEILKDYSLVTLNPHTNLFEVACDE